MSGQAVVACWLDSMGCVDAAGHIDVVASVDVAGQVDVVSDFKSRWG